MKVAAMRYMSRHRDAEMLTLLLPLMQEAKAAYQAELETGTKQEAIEAAANFELQRRCLICKDKHLPSFYSPAGFDAAFTSTL